MKTWKDIYKLPVHIDKYGRYVWDENGNMVAQFVDYKTKIKYLYLLDILNGNSVESLSVAYDPSKQIIFDFETKEPILMIRGWGGLTGIGGHKLSGEEASNIQDTFAQHWVSLIDIVKL